ncbi:hypothetical protein Ahy_A03g011093 [Arachis hypogaea]|uniref:GRF-type domain-containing protein n=1 Tax=Arachis hypogaea TaxID=3818 RepID=A0A445DPN8_ARAHY|nr:hypothetical protein Ahy_A03g011093 [Arachis hypogaea]
MIGRANEGDGSSIRSTTRTPSRSRASRVLDRCGCGKRPVLRWSGTDAHPDKPFFECPNYNCSGKRWCEFFRWTNIVEDDNDNFEETAAYKNEEISVSVAVRIGNLEAELRSQKYVIQILEFLNPGFGTNFKKFANLKNVTALAPCMGSTEADTGGGEFFLFVGNLSGLVVCGGGGGA